MFVQTFFLVSIIAVSTSCEKNENDGTSDPVEKSIAVVEDDTYASESFNEVEDIVDEAADNKVYYEVHDTLYQKVETANGFVYEVTGVVES